MFCDLNYRQDEGALEGLEEDGETTFKMIRQKRGCEEKQTIAYVQQEEKYTHATVYVKLSAVQPYTTHTNILINL